MALRRIALAAHEGGAALTRMRRETRNAFLIERCGGDGVVVGQAMRPAQGRIVWLASQLAAKKEIGDATCFQAARQRVVRELRPVAAVRRRAHVYEHSDLMRAQRL